VETTTPLDGVSQPLNGLYPTIQLYNASNTLLTSGAPLPDGRAQFLQYSGLAASGTYYLKVSPAGTTGEYFLGMVVNPPLVITTPGLSSWVVGTSFSQTVHVFGGAGTLTFATTSGTLPTGLTLSSSGVLSGTPTATGIYTFTVTVTDATGQSRSRGYAVDIYAAPPSSTLQVVAGSFTATPSGFSVQFNGPFVVSALTPVLYGNGYGASAPKASVLLTPGTIAKGMAVLGTGSNAGKVVSVTITSGGSLYNNPAYDPNTYVIFAGGGGSGATGTVNVNSSGVVTGVTIANQGSGYTSAPTVFFGVPDPVEGSLILDPVNDTLTFVETDTASDVNNGTPVLPDGTYTAVIRSNAATDGLKAAWNNTYLDGLGTGSAGSGDFTGTFTVNAAAAHDDLVWVPATAEGPGQPLNAPGGNTANSGYPLYLKHLSTNGNVTNVQVTFNYNPALLTIAGATNNSALTGSSFVLVSNDAVNGVAVFRYTDSGANTSHLTGDKVPLGYIVATVPSGSAATPMYYGSTEILHLSSVSINSGAVPVATADAVHLMAYVGDADNALHALAYIGAGWLNGVYDPNSAQLIVNTMLNDNTGFAAYALVDPVIVADTDGVGYIPSDAPLQVENILAGFANLLGTIPTATWIVF
jgi:Putative Ig domain